MVVGVWVMGGLVVGLFVVGLLINGGLVRVVAPKMTASLDWISFLSCSPDAIASFTLVLALW